jgi:hypothetical protein
MIIKLIRSIMFLFVIIIFLPGTICAGEIKNTKSSESVSNKLLVKFHVEVTDEKKAAIRKELGAELIKCLKEIRVEVWELPESVSIDDAITKLKDETSVEYSEPDYIYKHQSTPKDSKFINQWYLNNSGQEPDGTPSAFSGIEQGYMPGTSLSIAIVSGIAGLLLSHNPDLTRPETKEIIINSADDIDELEDKILSGGRSKAYNNALAMIVETGITSTASSASVSSSSDGGACFIAAAAYGSYDHPDVILLRKVRDRYLEKFELGRRFISAYYHYSPPLASLIKGLEILRYASRAALFPIVTFARLLIGFGFMFIAAVASFGYLLPFAVFFIMAREKKDKDEDRMQPAN